MQFNRILNSLKYSLILLIFNEIIDKLGNITKTSPLKIFFTFKHVPKNKYNLIKKHIVLKII